MRARSVKGNDSSQHLSVRLFFQSSPTLKDAWLVRVVYAENHRSLAYISCTCCTSYGKTDAEILGLFFLAEPGYVLFALRVKQIYNRASKGKGSADVQRRTGLSSVSPLRTFDRKIIHHLVFLSNENHVTTSRDILRYSRKWKDLKWANWSSANLNMTRVPRSQQSSSVIGQFSLRFLPRLRFSMLAVPSTLLLI